jgi:hypothetical protein
MWEFFAEKNKNKNLSHFLAHEKKKTQTSMTKYSN